MLVLLEQLPSSTPPLCPGLLLLLLLPVVHWLLLPIKHWLLLPIAHRMRVVGVGRLLGLQDPEVAKRGLQRQPLLK